jgi:gliding motility-associated-like protein
VNANSSCVAFNVALGTPVTADNCTVASVTNNAPAIFTLGTTTVTWTVTDASGNIATTIQTVTVVDNINPSIIAPAAITMNVVSGCSLSGLVLGTPFTLDNCSIATITNNAPTTFPIGTTTVVWTVTDGSGNIATANQLITIVDNINPTITAPAAVTMNVVSGCSATGVVLGTPITADNCSVASVTNNAPATFPIGTTTVTWTVTDGSGKTATATQLVTIVDNINPTITAPAAVSVNLTNGCAASNVVLGTPITADNCSVASITNNAPAIFQLGTTTVTWTVTDASGNSATSNQTVTVIDNINPTIVAPAAISMNVTSGCNVTGLALGTPFTADNCSVASVTNNAPTTFPIGTTTVVWTVTDGSGHTATANQLVTIVDNINPTITAPAAVTMNVVSGCSATGVVLGTPITADNCSVASVTNNAPAIFPIGTTTVVWTVTDASGKTATANQLVTIVDNINPTITAPAAVSVNLTNGCAASNVVLGTPITNDNCSVASVTNNAPAIFQLGTTTVTWTVTDASGLTATSNQIVTVIDNINPTIVAPAAISMNVTSGCNVTGLALGTPYTADNCSVASVTNNAPTTFPIGTTTVIWTVTDGSGHTATATQLVTIVDNINPTITAPAAINSYIASGCSATGIVLGTPVTTDNCSVASVTNNAPTSFPIGTTTVIWTVTDASGNTHTANQLVTVNDTLDPVITSPTSVTAYSNFGCQSVGVNLGTLTATDNCTIESITNNAPLFFPLGNTNVIWTVIDASGNSSTVTQLVTVVDTLKPTIIAPSNLEVASNTGCGASEISIGNPIVDDNCGVATINNDAPVVFVSGINIVTWTVTDNAGNVSTATQIVTVVDNVNPTAVLNNITVSLPVGSDAVITSDMIDNGSFDNCGNVTITLSQTNFNCDNLGNNTILVTVTDESGNFVSQSVVVTVNPSGIDLDLDGVDDACDQLIDQTVNVPNGFTPDGDGINDKFVIVGLDSYTSKALTIYNRYGNMVYETNNYQNDWDGSSNGSELPDGTYFYILELNGSETKSGYVYINRVH